MGLRAAFPVANTKNGGRASYFPDTSYSGISELANASQIALHNSPTANEVTEASQRIQGGRPEISFVLATLNEAANLPTLLREIEGSCKLLHEIIIVDDGSVDGTIPQIRSWVSSHQNILPIFNRSSRGLLNAHLQGLERASGRYVIVMDSDLQHPPSLIPKIYERLRAGDELVVASRYAPGGSAADRKPLRGIISRGATWVTHLLLPPTRGLSDPLSGYFGINLDSVRHYWPGHLGYKLLLFILAANDNPRKCEVPYDFHERRNGGSKVVNRTAFIPTFLRELLSDRRLMRANRETGHRQLNPQSGIAPPHGSLGGLRR